MAAETARVRNLVSQGLISLTLKHQQISISTIIYIISIRYNNLTPFKVHKRIRQNVCSQSRNFNLSYDCGRTRKVARQFYYYSFQF